VTTDVFGSIHLPDEWEIFYWEIPYHHLVKIVSPCGDIYEGRGKHLDVALERAYHASGLASN
jgi:hypothetical protein